MVIGPPAIKAGVVLFWMAWLSVVFLTNLFAGLKRVGIVPQGWK